MTENLLHKLEEKLVILLEQLEESHNQIKQLRQENLTLKTERSQSIEKMQDLMTMLDSVDGAEVSASLG